MNVFRTRRPRSWRPRSSGDDAGNVLVLVIGSTVMVALLLTVAIGFAVSQLKPAGTDQQAKAATAAAQAGIADYTARLNASPGYWQLLNTDGANNAAFTAAGRTIPGTASTSATSYTYSVLSSTAQTAATGIVRLQATGKAGPVTKTLTAAIQSRGFLQYLYQTDKEDLDPTLLTRSNSGCDQYWYGTSGRGNAGTGCDEVGFAAGDVITGPLHTNDEILLNGAATFGNPKTETSWPGAQPDAQGVAPSVTWRTTGGASITPNGTKPYFAPVVQIPSTNSSLQSVATQSGVNGCVYTGATRITFTGTSMKVLSPNTAYSASCYPFSGSATAGATVASVPSLIYVQQGSGTCAKADSTTSGVGYPLANEYVGAGGSWVSGDFDGPTYACTDGTAYVQGTLNGKATVATANDIVITGDLQYADTSSGSDDVLGLIPTNFAWVYHPVKQGSCNNRGNCSYSNLYTASGGLFPGAVHTVDAAILAVKDSFIVENWDIGPGISTSGTLSTYLNVQGTIAQNYRGPVGTGNASTGYLKNYTYDSRFEDGLQPPYFLQPVAQQWKPIQVSAG